MGSFFFFLNHLGKNLEFRLAPDPSPHEKRSSEALKRCVKSVVLVNGVVKCFSHLPRRLPGCWGPGGMGGEARAWFSVLQMLFDFHLCAADLGKPFFAR